MALPTSTKEREQIIERVMQVRREERHIWDEARAKCEKRAAAIQAKLDAKASIPTPA